MECQEFEAELEGRLDERLDPSSPELRAHADHCTTCQERLQQAVILLRGVVAWRQAVPKPSGDLVARIVESQRKASPKASPKPSSKGQWQAWIVAAAAMAAMWLVFVGTNFDNSGRADRRISAVGQRKVLTPPVAAANQLPAAKADLGTVLVSAEGAYSQLASETLEAAQDFALLWPTSQAVSNSTPTPTPQNRNSNWNQELSRELAPIGNSVGDALDFLWRAAPRVEKSPT